MKKYCLITGLFVVITVLVYAQQIATPTQMRMVYDINPAVIGISENISLTSRQVFSGIEGAPQMRFFSVNKLIDNQMGIGFNIYDGHQGFIQNRGIKAGYMYRVHLNESDFLSFGISVDLFQTIYDKEEYFLKNPDDPAFLNQQSEQSGVDFDAGVSYNTPVFYADMAVHQVPGRSVSLLNDYADSRRVRHYFLNAGYRFYLKNDLMLEPSLFFKTIEPLVFHADLGAKCVWKQMIWAGAFYRTSNIISATAGFKLDRYSFGFAWDYGFQQIFDYSTGSWEFQLIYDLSRSKAKVNVNQ